MNKETVVQDIESWITNFLEVPHPALGNWPPCPYARSARLKQSYDIRIGVDPFYDLQNQGRWGLGKWEVVIYAYDIKQWPCELFVNSIALVNKQVLLPRDLVALEDHPDSPEIVNGVTLNQGTYALALIQKLSDLNNKAQQLANQGFYHNWPESYLTALFQNRQDPR